MWARRERENGEESEMDNSETRVGCENTIACTAYECGKCFEYNTADNEDIFDACALFLSLSLSLSLIIFSLFRFFVLSPFTLFVSLR